MLVVVRAEAMKDADDVGPVLPMVETTLVADTTATITSAIHKHNLLDMVVVVVVVVFLLWTAGCLLGCFRIEYPATQQRDACLESATAPADASMIETPAVDGGHTLPLGIPPGSPKIARVKDPIRQHAFPMIL